MQRELRYALVCEGATDIVPLRTIVERLAEASPVRLVFQEELSKPVAGPISLIQVKLRTSQNFVKNNIDLAFFFSDNDKGEPDKEKVITQGIESISPLYLETSVIGVPDPHMEAWLLADENNVKTVFGLPANHPIPFDDLTSQPRLSALANSCGVEELTPPEARRRLAENMNLTVAERQSASFNAFVGHYRDFLNRI